MWNNLSKAQQITAGGGVAALVAGFLPWYSVGDEFFAVSVKGTDLTFGWMGMVLFLAAAALTIAPAFGKNVGTDQIQGEQIAIIAAALGSLMWLYRLIDTPFGIGRGYGLFVALAAGAAVTAGVVMNMKDKGIAMPTTANFTSNNTETNATTPMTPAAAPMAPPVVQQAPVAPPVVQQAPVAPPVVQQAPVAPPVVYPAVAPTPANDTPGHIEF